MPTGLLIYIHIIVYIIVYMSKFIWANLRASTSQKNTCEKNYMWATINTSSSQNPKVMGLNVDPYHWIDDHPPIWEINITGWWFQPLWKKISQWEGWSHILWKINVPNHQPDKLTHVLTLSHLIPKPMAFRIAYAMMFWRPFEVAVHTYK